MSKAETSADAQLRRLEADLDAAIERARLAKQAVKAAKADAKRAKKDRKRARRALIEAQEGVGLRGRDTETNAKSGEQDDGGEHRTTGARIAESPERRRSVPRRRTTATRRPQCTVTGNEPESTSTRVPIPTTDTSEPSADAGNDSTKTQKVDGSDGK